jgi:glucose/arabinose dehydrogenase
MRIHGGIHRLPRLFPCILSGAFLLAILTPVAFADSPPRIPSSLPAIVLTQLPGGLSNPVHVANAGDGSGRLFVVEQAGTIRIFKNGAFLATPFLDIHSLVSCCGEEGLLSVAFHPNYAVNGYFYVYYANNLVSPGDITLARYHVSAAPDVADPSSAQVVLVVPHPTNTNHYGGQLFFGPVDSYLYMGTGDGGSGGDPPNNAQNLNVLLGKIMRLDVDGSGAVPCGQSTAAPYAIPPTNPFVGIGGCDEIWAYGVRNPWRFSFDRATGDLLIGDVGQNLYEEVDFQPAASAGGENYGWRRMEGFHCYNPATGCDDGTLTLPILEETHNPGGWCALIGGFRYRGTAIPALVGVYLYGDTCLGQIWGATESGGTWSAEEMLAPGLTISSFGEDQAGEVYVADLGGAIYRIDGVTNPVPSVAGLLPGSKVAGDPAFTLTVSGSGFVPGATVRWNGADRPTSYVSAASLTAAIPASDVATAGVASVTVFNPIPGGGTSGPFSFYVNVTFLDVPTTYFAAAYVQAIVDAGVTAGCAPRLFCPERPTSRAEMAVFLVKSAIGGAYVPPLAQGGVFADVHPGDFAADWIEDLARRNITSGCDAANYCPNRAVTRAEIAVLLLKTSQGAAYVPPLARGGVFADVHPGDFGADWIEDLAARGITGGCDSVPNFCPARSVTRAEVAVFLTKTFNLPLP